VGRVALLGLGALAFLLAGVAVLLGLAAGAALAERADQRLRVAGAGLAVAAVMSAVGAAVTSSWVLGTAGAIAAFGVGMLAASLLRRRGRGAAAHG